MFEKLWCAFVHIGSLTTMTFLNFEHWKVLFLHVMFRTTEESTRVWFIWWYVILFTITYVIPCYLFMTYLGTADYDCKDGQTRRGEKICGMLIESRWSTTCFFLFTLDNIMAKWVCMLLTFKKLMPGKEWEWWYFHTT